jgi:hypothetical protein
VQRPVRRDRYQQAEIAYVQACEERVRGSDELPRGQERRVVERLPWMSIEGCQYLPNCAVCESPLVYRGGWDCDACRTRHPMRGDYVGIEIPRSLPVEATAGLDALSGASWGPEGANVFSSKEGHNSSPEKNRMAALEALTSPYRAGRAARLLARGAKPTVDGTVMSAWHAARARGVAERFARIGKCGELLGVAENDEGRSVPVEYRCGDWRACPRCKKHRKHKLKLMADDIRELALKVLRPEMGRYYGGGEGRWSEKMLTLTVPHSGDVRVDARRGRRAWVLFVQRLREHWRSHRGLGKERGNTPWAAGIEIARAEHWHKHCWMVAPFVDVALLRVWWGRALLEAGVPPELMPFRRWGDVRGRVRDEARVRGWLGIRSDDDLVPWPVVDLRGGNLADYAVKIGLVDYALKADGVPASVHPAQVALAYEALDGTRVTQCARGWRSKDGRKSIWRLRRYTAEEHAAWCAALAKNQAVSARKRLGTEAPACAEQEAPPVLSLARAGPEIEKALPEVTTPARPVIPKREQLRMLP